MKILDATAGSRGIWFQKNLPFVTFMDKREGRFVFYPNPKTKRTFDIKPDVVADWTKTIPFDDNYFDMVLFDPPHLIVSNHPKSDFKMHIQYSYLLKDNWKQALTKGFKELFKILKKEGFLVLKWCETDIKITDIIKLSPYKPLFSNKSLTCNPNEKDTYMVVFTKYNVNKKLEIK